MSGESVRHWGRVSGRGGGRREGAAVVEVDEAAGPPEALLVVAVVGWAGTAAIAAGVPWADASGVGTAAVAAGVPWALGRGEWVMGVVVVSGKGGR